MKQCKVCNEVFGIDMFYKNNSMKDGHLNTCIKCYLKIKKEYSKKFRIDNRNRVKKYSATYRSKNKAYFTEKALEWAVNNKEKAERNRKKYRSSTVKDLRDVYVGQLLKVKGCQIPVEMIEAKRLQMLINRTIQEMTK